MHGISSTEKKTIQNLLQAIEPLGATPFPFITTFLAIVPEEGRKAPVRVPPASIVTR